MAYINEFAKYGALSSLIKDKSIQEFIANIKIYRKSQNDFETIDDYVAEKINENERLLDYVFAFDGSKINVPVENGLPGAEIGVLKIGHVCINIQKYDEYEKAVFNHPLKYADIFNKSELNFILPGINVFSEEINNPKDFFRKTWFETFEKSTNQMLMKFFEENKITEPPTSLLDSFKSLLKKTNSLNVVSPLNNKSDISLTDFYSFDDEHFKNSIEKDGNIIYITDLMSLTDLFGATQSNDGLYSQAMSILEKVMFFNLIENLIKFMPKEYFKKIGFILDGPLALYNISTWIAKAINEKLIDFQKIGFDIFVLGVEKFGAFMEHFEYIDFMHKNQDNLIGLKPGMLFYLNDDYIRKYIRYSPTNQTYGKDTYFGKKLFYKNRCNDLFVVNHGFISHEDKENFKNNRNSKEYFSYQKRLNDIVWIFERFKSSRFRNALSFISFAHENVALSNTEMSKKMMNSFIHNKY